MTLLLLDIVLYILVFSLFPNGQFMPRWIYWLVVAEIISAAILAYFPTPLMQPTHVWLWLRQPEKEKKAGP